MQTRALKVALHSAQGLTPSDATDRLLLKSVSLVCSAVGTQLLGASRGTQHAPKGTWASGQTAGWTWAPALPCSPRPHRERDHHRPLQLGQPVRRWFNGV